jgi:hypothetical protein
MDVDTLPFQITAIRINDIFNEFSSFESYCYEKSTLEKVGILP